MHPPRHAKPGAPGTLLRLDEYLQAALATEFGFTADALSERVQKFLG